MNDTLIHALVLIQNWGEEDAVLKELKRNPHIISIFHIMGRHSYLLDVNFDGRDQLAAWITRLKAIKLESGVPAIISMQTQKIIEVLKQKDTFSLNDYLTLRSTYHFFVKIDNPHHDDSLLRLLTKSPIVGSVLHVQGGNSFTIEVIVSDYEDYRKLLSQMKKLKTIHHIETQEVISVIKYRNQVLNEELPRDDIRMLYTL